MNANLPNDPARYIPTAELSETGRWDVENATEETTMPCEGCGRGVILADAYSIVDEYESEVGQIACGDCHEVAIGDAR